MTRCVAFWEDIEHAWHFVLFIRLQVRCCGKRARLRCSGYQASGVCGADYYPVTSQPAPRHLSTTWPDVCTWLKQSDKRFFSLFLKPDWSTVTENPSPGKQSFSFPQLFLILDRVSAVFFILLFCFFLFSLCKAEQNPNFLSSDRGFASHPAQPLLFHHFIFLMA